MILYPTRWSRFHGLWSIWICALLLTVLISCKGQETESRQATPESNNTSSTPSQPMLDMMADPMRPITNVRIDDFYPGQLCHWVRNIVEDPEGNLWFGTNHFGVMRYDGEELNYFTEANGFGGTRVTGMLVDGKGVVWFATSGGLTKYEDGQFTTYTTKDGLPTDYTWSLLLDQNDQLWVGTTEGLCIFDGTTCIPFEYPKPPVEDPDIMMAPERVSSLMEDQQGRIWIATDGQGITIYNGDSFEYLTEENGLANNSVSELLQATDGRIWIGSMLGGMTIYYDDDFFVYPSPGNGVQGEEVGALYEDTDGSVWFASEGYGVYRFADGLFERFDQEQGLITSGIIRIFRDSQDRFWFGGWKGLSRLQDGQFSTVTRSGPWN